jgi:ABC-type lipoprotein release transport system permease subunit
MPSSIPLARLAWRNIWRNTRRTLLTLAGIVFGVFFAVLTTGLADATYGDMIDYAAKMGVGHVSIEHKQFIEAPSLEHTVQIDEALQTATREDARVAHVSHRISGAVLVATAEGNQGASMMAIDPANEGKETLLFLDEISEGALFERAEDRTVTMGSALAQNLGVGLKKKVVVTATSKSGEIVSAMYRVSGLITTGAPSIDRGLIILPLGAAQDLLGYGPGEVTAAAVYLRDHRDADAVTQRLAGLTDPPSVAVDWKQSQPELASFISMKEVSGVIVQALVMVMLAAGIFNTIFVSVMERRHEFGVLRAIGFSPTEIFRMVTWESFWIACAGLLASALLVTFPYLKIAESGLDYSKLIEPGMEVSGVAMDPIMSIGIYPVNLLIIIAVVFLGTMTAGLIPAWRASRTEPIEAIHR